VNIDLKKYLEESMTSTAVGGFVGSKGQGIDKKYAGPFYPTPDDLLLLLKKQDIDSIVKTKFSNLHTPISDILFSEVDWDYKYDKEGTAYSFKELVFDDSGIDNSEEFIDKYKNQSNTKMKLINTYMKEVG
jgi:hypothetical protein